jgi:hypothetical protein
MKLGVISARMAGTVRAAMPAHTRHMSVGLEVCGSSATRRWRTPQILLSGILRISLPSASAVGPVADDVLGEVRTLTRMSGRHPRRGSVRPPTASALLAWLGPGLAAITVGPTRASLMVGYPLSYQPGAR